MTISINTKLIAAVAKWANNDFGKLNLRMVLFAEREIVACDGHRLVRVPSTYSGPRFGVDRRHLLSAVAAQNGLGDKSIDIKLDGKTVEISLGDGVSMRVPSRDADTYPPIDAVMPKITSGPLPDPIGFNPRYLDAIAEVINADDCGRYGVRITGWGGQLDSMLFESGSGIRFVIMPVRL